MAKQQENPYKNYPHTTIVSCSDKANWWANKIGLKVPYISSSRMNCDYVKVYDESTGVIRDILFTDTES